MRDLLTALAILLAPLLCLADETASFPPGPPWAAGKAVELKSEPAGGPKGGAWMEVKCGPQGYANMQLKSPLALEPGSVLKVWVKGNETKDVLSLYLFGGEGHRAYNLTLDDPAWKELSFDVTEDFGENTWTWDEARRLDLGNITSFKLYAQQTNTTGAAPVGIGAIRFERPAKSDKPSVLLVSCAYRGGDPAKEYRIIPHLRAAGFETKIQLMYGVGSATYLSHDQLARFNAVIVLDLPQAEKGGYPRNFARVADVLREYVEAGGGLLCTAMPGGWNNCLPTINRFLKPWGAEYLDEQVVDPDTVLQSPTWFQSYPFSWTDNVAKHPVTEGVKGTWFPAKAWRADGILTTAAAKYSGDWSVVLRGKTSAVSLRPDGGNLVTKPALTYKSEPPLLAVRQAGKGRVGVLPISSSYLTAGCDHPAWKAMCWDGEANKLKSDMKPLFLNTIRWLAAPSREAKTLGGYAEPKGKVDYRPPHERPTPINWAEMKFREPKHEDYAVLIGMRSSLSGGAASPAEMIAAAKVAGYTIAIFTEQMPGMDGAKWKALTEACAKSSDDKFLALPGLNYRDPQGNHYLMFGAFDWPNAEWYKKCFNEKGEVIDTYVLYAKVSGWRHTAIHTLKKNHNPVLHLRHYSCVSVFTYENDRLVDDSYDDYLLLEENCYYPIPIAVHFVQTTDGVKKATSGFQTCLWAASLKEARESLLDGGKAGESYFWNPKPTYLSSGVRLDDWQELNMNSWRASAPGTDLWKFRFAVESDAPLQEVKVMDGTRLYRCFRPNAKRFEREQSGYHGKQNQFTLRARDANGAEMVSSHLKTHTMEHVFFMCGDRQNSLGEGSWGYQTWPAQYGTAPKVDIYDLFPPHWDGTAPGHGSFCTATVATRKGFDAKNENDLGYMASTNRTLMASRDCTITEMVGDKKFPPPNGRSLWSDCKPTAPLLNRQFLTQRVRRYHFRVPDGTPGFMLVEGEVKAVGNFKSDDRPGEMGVVLYNMGDRGGKNGELDHFAYRASDGTCVVRFTPPGARLFTAADVAKQGDYFAEFPRRLGAPAIFPLTEVAYRLYGAPNLFGTNFGLPLPGGEAKAGTTWKYRFLYAVFLSEPGELNEPAERIREAFGLAGDVAYSPQLVKGEIKDKVYWLRLQALDGGAAVNVEKTNLPGGLPVIVDGLNDRWSAVIADRKTGKFIAFIGVLDGTGYGLVDIRQEPLALFAGHPVRCGDPNLFIQLLSWGKNGTSAEVHNPTEQPVKTWIESSPDCSFLKPGRVEAEVPAGASVVVKF